VKNGWRKALVLGALLLSGCAASPEIKATGMFDSQLERETVYIAPFDATLVPPDFAAPIFDRFVDILNARRKQTRVGSFVILKEDLQAVEPSWLDRQVYISGDIWGYQLASGCCSTDLKVKSKIYFHEQGNKVPVFEVFIPAEYFYEHDRSDPAAAKNRLGGKLAQELAEAVLKKLTP